MEVTNRLRWIRSACDWSDFSEPVDFVGNDAGMVYFENDVTAPNQQFLLENGSALYVGRYTRMQGSSLISPMLSIGRHCTIAYNVLLGGGRHHMEYLTTGEIPGLESDRGYHSDAEDAFADNDLGAFTRIGCDVSIGANASVLRGRSVGTGACIGAGAVVTKDVPPYAIVVGNPGRILRYRFAPPMIESLLRTRWWRLPAEVIRALPFKDIERCVAILEEMRSA